MFGNNKIARLRVGPRYVGVPGQVDNLATLKTDITQSLSA